MMFLRGRAPGFVLITVLVFVALTASLLAVVLHNSAGVVHAAATYADVMRADELGRAAADLVAGRVMSDDPDAKRGGRFAVHLHEADVFVDYLSESARIDANLAPIPLLLAVFEAAGLEPSEAAAIGKQINTWRMGTGKQKDGDQRATQGAKTEPAIGKMIEDLAQLPASWQITPAEAGAVRPALTLANGTATVDPIIAGRLVIKGLFDGKARLADSFLERRSAGFSSEVDARAALPLKSRRYISFVPASAYRAHALVRLSSGFERSYELEVVPPKTAGQTVKTIAWRVLD
jgi:general secretion pathway protein K